MAPQSPFRRVADGIEVALRVTPKASRNVIDGLKPAANGPPRLAVKVTAVADRGKANQAVISLLAKTWRLPPSRFSLVTGATDRNKLLHIAGAADELLPALQAGLKATERVT